MSVTTASPAWVLGPYDSWWWRCEWAWPDWLVGAVLIAVLCPVVSRVG